MAFWVFFSSIYISLQNSEGWVSEPSVSLGFIVVSAHLEHFTDVWRLALLKCLSFSACWMPSFFFKTLFTFHSVKAFQSPQAVTLFFFCGPMIFCFLYCYNFTFYCIPPTQMPLTLWALWEPLLSLSSLWSMNLKYYHPHGGTHVS